MFRLPVLISTIFLMHYGFHAHGQASFERGFIIDNDKDTVRGWIDYRGNFKTFSKCSFKAEESGPVSEYLPQHILGYGINSRVFASKNLSNDGVTRNVFLEYLTRGADVALYYFQDDVNKDLFFIERNGILYALKDEIQTKEINERTYINHTYEYRNVLTSIFSDNPSLIVLIKDLSLDRKSLIKFVTVYIGQTGDQTAPKFTAKSKPVHVNIMPLVGVASTISEIEEYNIQISTTDSVLTRYSSTTSKPSSNMVYGIRLNFTELMNSIGNRFSIDLELLYGAYTLNNFRSYYFKYQSHNINNPPHPTQGQVHDEVITINQNVLQSFLRIKYAFPKGMIRPNFSFGLSGNFLISKGIHREVLTVYSAKYDYTVANPVADYSSSISLVNFSVGAAIGSLTHPVTINLMFDRYSPAIGQVTFQSIKLVLGFQL